jgi:hypothetical protein
VTIEPTIRPQTTTSWGRSLGFARAYRYMWQPRRMTCPHCQSNASHVVDSRPVANGVRRRRECERCGKRFTTLEHLRTVASAGRREPERAAA